MQIRRLRQRQRPPWKQLSCTHEVPNAVESTAARHCRTQAEEEVPPTLVLHCQRCREERNFANTAPLRNGSWIALQCKLCKAAGKINRWLCVCGIQWHTCPAHAPVGFRHRRRTTTTAKKHLARRTAAKLTPLGQPNAPTYCAGRTNPTRQSLPMANTHRPADTATTTGSSDASNFHHPPVLERAPAPKKQKVAKAVVTRKRVLTPDALACQTDRLVQAFKQRKLAELSQSRQVDGYPSEVGEGGSPEASINLTHGHSKPVT